MFYLVVYMYTYNSKLIMIDIFTMSILTHLLGVDVVGEFLMMKSSSEVTEEGVDSSEEVIGQSRL